MRSGPHTRNPANVRIPPSLLPDLWADLQLLNCPQGTHLKNEIFSKYVSSATEPPHVRRQRAINKWLAVERENGCTNERLLALDPGYNIIPGIEWKRFIDRVSMYAESILGAVPPADLFGRFSGGASTSRSRAEGHPALKLGGKADVGERALDLAVGVLVDSPAWLRHCEVELEVVPGNVLFTVPKQTDIDRVAAKEPDLNMFLQLGVGDFISRRLLARGIDLYDQSINRELARKGSLDGSLATLDLSSASDSISRQLVMEILPIHWFRLLDDLRSPITVIDGEEHVNEMFSSMGNGFTFPLESLLFYCISRAVAYFEGVSGVISVYGDDIIVPVGVSDPLIIALSFLGFTVNEKKSFSTGSFRESCGGHYDGGRDVTPFYIKSEPKDLFDLILLGNKILEWSLRPGLGVPTPDLLSHWERIKELVPPRLWGGQRFGTDDALVTGDLPRYKLTRRYRKAKPVVGDYLLSLNSSSGGWKSLSDPCSTGSSRLSTSYDVWIRKNRELVNSDITRLSGYIASA